MADRDLDVVVIGGGPVGEVAAARIAKHGLSVALVERELYGGECSYWACIPSKTLLRPVDLAHAAARVPGAVQGQPDVRATLARRDRIAGLDDAGQAKWLEASGVEGVRGHGRLAGERRVEVTTRVGDVVTYAARHAVVIATGSDPVIPDVPGLREAGPWTNREVTRMASVPLRLLVIGGGPVAVEMAQAAKGLGAEEVTLLVAGGRLLERMEPFVGDLVLAGLRRDGIDVRLGARATSVRRGPDGVTTDLEEGGRIASDEILVAAGRSPRIRDLGTRVLRVKSGRPLQVDDSMRVDGFSSLYAVGDVNGRAPLTHMGKYQARVAGDVIAARASGSADDALHMRAVGPVTQVVFTDPQVAAVGMTERDARVACRSVRTVTKDLAEVAGASLMADGYEGRAALVLDDDRGVVVGATFVGPDVAELLHAATIAVACEVPIERLGHAVPSFPTVSEAWLDLVEAAIDGRGRPSRSADHEGLDLGASEGDASAQEDVAFCGSAGARAA